MDGSISGYEVTERLEEFRSTSLYSGVRQSDRRLVLIKTLNASYPRKAEIARLVRERALLERLADAPGIAPLGEEAVQHNGAPVLVIEAGGRTLAQNNRGERLRSWTPLSVLDFALGLFRAIRAVHEHDIVHQNVAPQNILLGTQPGHVQLLNFEIASEISRERQASNAARRLAGSLPYISPEQTGRLSRDLDYRSDYYSAGMVLYELLADHHPFDATTTIEWVHAHISRVPPPPERPGEDIPEMLSALILKLLSKNPDERYQSSFGVLADLQRCRRELAQTNRIATFDLGTKDLPEHFHVPQQLFGRETEIAQLSEMFQRVTEGETEFCLVSGYSGIGKSALVGEMNRPIVRAGGYFVSGKFEQFHRNRPYVAISAAFSGFVHQLLAERRERLEYWREEIAKALGPNARVLIDLVPDLERITGPAPPVPELPPTEAQNRLQIVFQDFIRLMAGAERPLVLFLDDLQWADSPTLNLLQKLATARDVGHLMIIGAYRSNEVDAQHLLSLTRAEIGKTRAVQELTLAPLRAQSVAQIVAGALRAPPEVVGELSAYVFQKTEGNPFFVGELLRSLEEDRLIRLDRDRGAWVWDMSAVTEAPIADSVVDFVLSSLERLPPETRTALQLAACIGSVFDLRTLSIVHERGMAEVAQELMAALRRNAIVPLDEGYKYVGTDDVDTPEADAGVNPRFKFQHDRIQQAAYSLIDPDRRQAVHLSIGRLLQSLPEEDQDTRLIEIVRHLNEGRALVTDAAERETLAELNLAAAREAHAASAYETALSHVETGRGLLSANAWGHRYDLAKDLSSAFVQNAYLTGRYDEAEAETDRSLGEVKTALEKAEILSMRTRQYSTMGRPDDSILAAIEGLRLLGIDITLEPPEDVLADEISQIEINLAGRDIAALADAPHIADPEVEVAIRLLMEIFPPAFLSNAGNLFQYLVVKSVNLAMTHGNSTETAFAYAAYGMLLCGALSDPWTGFQYGRLALAMNETLDDIGLKSRIIYVYAMFIHHWSNHWSSMTEWFKKGIETGYQSGDLLYLAYNAQDCIIWDPTLDLETASEEQRKYLEIVRDTGYRDSHDSGTLFRQMQLNFLGQTEDRYSLNDEEFDETACYEGMRTRKFMTGLANFHIYKTEIHTFYGDWAGAARHISAQDQLMASVMSLPQQVRYRFSAFVALSAMLRDIAPIERSEIVDRLNREHVEMMRWAANCPENFRHLELAMAGQLAWVADDGAQALRQLNTAVAVAAENGWTRDEAMIHEMIARLLKLLDMDLAALSHLKAAYYLYYRWGAKRKLEVMEEQTPALAGTVGAETSPETPGAEAGIAQERIDLDSIMNAARAISSEIKLDTLWTRVMQILLENAGAQRGVMVVRRDGRLQADVVGSAEQGIAPLTTPADIDADHAGALASAAVINYALRTRDPVVLDNAAETRRFRGDPYIARQHTRSILCVPIVRQDQFEGAIYLENNLTEGAFTEDRVQVVELLAAQASISIENARLYVSLERKVAERTEELSKKSAALEQVSNQLAKYLSPQIYRSIFDSQTEVRLTSERKRLTIFFLDLVGFTATADRLESEELTQLLNQYLTELSNIALAYGATIDKFMGDAIMIFFGDPETKGPQEDALACVRMAIDMRRRIAELREDWLAWGIEKPLECRMGIHTGYCTVGNFGSESRLDYTIIGGSVNLASRLESLAEPGEIIISYETYAQVRHEVCCEERGHINVRGISHPVGTYQVMDLWENMATQVQRIQTDMTNLHLDVDISRMSAEERARAADILRAAAARLTNEDARPGAAAPEADTPPKISAE